jgi:hypothetical protein
MGNPDASSKRLEGVQEVLSDAATDEREALSKLDRRASERGGNSVTDAVGNPDSVTVSVTVLPKTEPAMPAAKNKRSRIKKSA